MLTNDEIGLLLRNLHTMTAAQKGELLASLDELERRKRAQMCQDDFLAFCVAMNPKYRVGAHHRRLARLLMDMEAGITDRIGVSVPPRHGKSEMVSILFPAWYLGRHPDHDIILASHTAELAVSFGRKVRNLIGSQAYGEIFPAVSLAADSKSAGRWNTNKGGAFYATGVGSALAGRGAHFCVGVRTEVITLERGVVPAGSVQAGEHLYTHTGFVPVLGRVDSIHCTTVHFNSKGEMTREHPVWVFGRGWIQAKDVRVGDYLWTTNIWDNIRSSITRGAYHVITATRKITQSGIQHLGDDAPTLQQPTYSKLHNVWRGWCAGVRALEGFCSILRGYGRSPHKQTYAVSDRERQGVRAGELPLGDGAGAKQQPQEHNIYRGAGEETVCCSMGARNRDRTRRVVLPRAGYEDDRRSRVEHTEDEPQQTPDTATYAGRMRACVARWFGRCRTQHGICELRAREKTLVCKAQTWAMRNVGVLVGVRRVEQVDVHEHEPRLFVNFHVGGDNTFVDDSILSHNCIIDDPFSEQDVLAGNYTVFDKVYEWFTYGARTRLMKDGKIAVVHTRWAPHDLIGRLATDMVNIDGGDKYEFFEFPAILHEHEENEDGESLEKALWPEFFDLDALRRTRASMPLFQWNAQYQQQPTGKSGAIVKRDDWKAWIHDDPPTNIEYIIMALDAAAETKNRSDFSAITTWGVFRHEQLTNSEPHIILLNAINERVEYPELKRVALREYKQWKPDCFIVEKKSNGVPLYAEMRRMGIAVTEFNPSRATGDKVARVNAIADIFSSGFVWYPQGRKWAEQVIEQMAAFPTAEHDDLVDTVSMALSRFRSGGFIRLPTDYEDTDEIHVPQRAYY